MSLLSIEVGNRVRLYTESPFTDADTDEVFDPDSVQLVVVHEDDPATALHVYDWPTELAGSDGLLDHDVEDPANGLFEKTIIIEDDDPDGRWNYRFRGYDADGEPVGSRSGSLFVKRPTVRLVASP